MGISRWGYREFMQAGMGQGGIGMDQAAWFEVRGKGYRELTTMGFGECQ